MRRGAGSKSGAPSCFRVPLLVLLEEERVEVGARVGGLEQVPTGAGGDELTLVAVVVGGPRRVVLRDVHVDLAVGVVPLVARELVGGGEPLVHARDVEVRQVVVVRVMDVVTV